MIEWVIGGIVFLVMLFVAFMTYLEEKRKCKHKWEEGPRSLWGNGFGGDFIKVELRCKICGDVEVRRI